MRHVARALLLALVALGAATYPLVAEAMHRNDPHSRNMKAMGESLRPGGVTTPGPWDTRNTDLAFWRNLAIQGRYDGFRVVDVSDPAKPTELAYFKCVSAQGDVGIFGHLVFRSVDSGVSSLQCKDVAHPLRDGFEGIQIFDISDLSNIRQVGAIALDCGSHTHTVVPDLENDRVLIYNSTSESRNQETPGPFGNQCSHPFNRFDIVEVPLDDPGAARVIGFGPLGADEMDEPIEMCHDIGVILGDVNKAACAGHHMAVILDISDKTRPVPLLHVIDEEVTGWHSAALTWDGKVLVLGWEPGGGTRPRCLATGQVDPTSGVAVTDNQKSLFFHDAQTGELLGKWLLPRPQSATENCTIHNYNVLPIRGRYLVLHGSYQSGTSLVDFTDPANAYEVAYSDPDPLDRTIHPRGGVWSSYWYNGFIYESDTTRGLRIYQVTGPHDGGGMHLPYLNPQTQDFSLPAAPHMRELKPPKVK